jgi:hypothetical protein
MDYKNRGHLCAIINTYGDAGPLASEDSLEYFQADFINECLDKAYKENNHKERRNIINGIREELGHEVK